MTQMTTDERRAKLSKLSKPVLVEIIHQLCVWSFCKNSTVDRAVGGARGVDMERRLKELWAQYETYPTFTPGKTLKENAARWKNFADREIVYEKWCKLSDLSIEVIKNPWHGL